MKKEKQSWKRPATYYNTLSMPQALADKLKRRAKRNNRTVIAEVRHILAQAVESEERREAARQSVRSGGAV